MGYIGSKPADKALTSDDITDGIVSTAKIQDNAVTTAKTSYSDAPFRNIIINGDMSIAQRGTSTASITSTSYNTCDRFQTVASSLGTWTQSQSTDVPSGQGFSSSLKMDCTTADASPAAADELRIRQNVEGQNLQYLKKGTSSAESVTISFWVKSNKTGTYIVELMDNDNSYRHINKSYTIDSASTWEKKTITFAGDTTGAFSNDNGAALAVSFWLGAGSNFTSGTLQTSWGTQTNANRAVGQINLADSTANEWYITGVQLEAGTTASDFEFVPYDVNYARCLRYYEIGYGNVRGYSAGQIMRCQSNYQERKRTTSPTEYVYPSSADRSAGTNSGKITQDGNSRTANSVSGNDNMFTWESNDTGMPNNSNLSYWWYYATDAEL